MAAILSHMDNASSVHMWCIVKTTHHYIVYIHNFTWCCTVCTFRYTYIAVVLLAFLIGYKYNMEEKLSLSRLCLCLKPIYFQYIYWAICYKICHHACTLHSHTQYLRLYLALIRNMDPILKFEPLDTETKMERYVAFWLVYLA